MLYIYIYNCYYHNYYHYDYCPSLCGQFSDVRSVRNGPGIPGLCSVEGHFGETCMYDICICEMCIIDVDEMCNIYIYIYICIYIYIYTHR